MVRPNLLVIGAQKCGTSALYRLFEAHPDCAVSSRKEPNFFVDDAPFPFGKWFRGLDWYADLYGPDAVTARIVADVSPSYAASPEVPGVPARAASVVPDATVVYLVRDPIDRIVSHWRHWTAAGYESRAFAEAALDVGYVSTSSYATQLKLWLAVYPSEQVMVMHQDDVAAGAVAVFERFGLTPSPAVGERANVTDDRRTARFPSLPKNVTRRLPSAIGTKPVPRPVVTDELRARLLEVLAPEMHEFENLTGVRPARL